MYLLTKKYLNSVVIVDHTEKNSTYFKIYAYKHIEIMKTLYYIALLEEILISKIFYI